MKVGVIGAGTMGAGICEVFAKAGWDVAMTASSAASAQKHKDKLAAGYAKRVAKGKMAQERLTLSWLRSSPVLRKTFAAIAI